jgi:hypothetical protein
VDAISDLLDGNPRALKRFVNTYRLVKAALSDVESEVFVSSTQTGTPPPYRVCMAQLAMLATQRPRALALVRGAQQAPSSNQLADWLDRLAKDADPDGQAVAEGLRHALGDDGVRAVKFETFALWLERTRRYSFYL